MTSKRYYDNGPTPPPTWFKVVWFVLAIISIIWLMGNKCSAQDIIVNWQAPTHREDETPLLISEIDKFNIYWGTTTGDYQNTIPVDLNLAISYEFKNAPAQDIYLVMSTVDTDGRESVYSPEVHIEYIETLEPPTNIRIIFDTGEQ